MDPNSFLHNPHLPGEAFDLPGTGPNGVLLFHGFTATCSEVIRLGRTLNKLGYTAVGPLLPGHGTQPADLNKVRWQDWTDAAEAAYADLAGRCKRVVVGGESNGGLVALYLATQHPEIAAVLAYAPALQSNLSWLDRLKLRLLAPFIAAAPKGDLTGNTTWQGYKVNPLKAVIQHLALQEEVRQRLPRITQPLLIVQSRLDKTIDPAGAQVVYDRVKSPLKELHWMDHSGHCVLLDDEVHLVNRMTIDFLFKAMAAPKSGPR